MTDNEKILVMVRIAGSAQEKPSPRKPKRPAEIVAAFFNVRLK